MPTSRKAYALAAALLACCLLASGAMPAQAAGAGGHKIVSVDGPKTARKLAVRLPARGTQADLQALARTLAGRMKSGEGIATIDFYLRGMELNAMPWARATLQPADKIEIFGMRAEEEAALRAQAALDTRDVVGVWITAAPALPGLLTIYRKGPRAYAAEWQLKSGKKTSDDLTVSRESRGQRFDVTGGDGAYYLAAWSGDLLLGDRTRVIAVAERLAVEPAKPAAAQAARAVPALSPAAAAKNATQTAPASTQASAEAALALPAEAPPAAKARPRRAAKRVPAKKSSSVADLMGGSIAR